MKFGRADMCCLILYLLIFYRLNGVLGEMNFGGLPSCGNADVDGGFALAGDLGLLAEEDHAERSLFHDAVRFDDQYVYSIEMLRGKIWQESVITVILDPFQVWFRKVANLI